ncbi:MAG: hypothetical protein Kow0010_02300 [Dehalococcoidia bacterium]
MIAAASVLFALVAEAIAVYVVAEWVNAGFDEPERKAPSAIAFVVVALAGFAIPRVLLMLGRFDVRGAVLALALSFLVIYGAVRIEFAADLAVWDFGWALDFVRDAESAVRDGRAEFLGAVFLVVTWLRAAWRSNAGIEIEMLPRAFAPSFFIVTFVTVLALGTDRSEIVSRGAIGFYAFALLSLACAQLSLSGATFGDIQAGGITTFLLAATAGATFVGVLVVGLVLGVAWDLAGPIVTGPIASGLQAVVAAVLTPPAWLLAKFFSWLFGLAGDPALPDREDLLTPDGFTGDEVAPEDGQSTFNRVAGYALRALALLGVLGVFALLVILVVRWHRRLAGGRASPGEAGSAGGLGEDLRSAFRSVFRRRGGTTPSGQGVVRLYLEVLERAEHAGVRREPWQTPHELAPALHDTFHTQVTDEITAAFEEARYGGRDPDPGSIRALQERWQAARSGQ